MRTHKINLIVFFTLFINQSWVNRAIAQTKTLPQIIEAAHKNNQLLKIGALDIEGQQVLVKTTRELPKTNLDVQFGRTQTVAMNDYTLGLTQQFVHPKLMQAHGNLLQSQVESSRKNLEVRKSEITSTVKFYYYQLLYYQLFMQNLQQQDSLYRSALRAAEIRLKTGETNLLEKVSAETRLQEISNHQATLRMNEAIAYQQLKTLMNTQDDFKIDFSLPAKKDNSLIINDLTFDKNPVLAFQKQQTEISQKQTKLEKQKLKPDFRVGIISQSIEHRANQMIMSAGIGIPIFTQAQKSRISASAINEKISQSNVQYLENQLFSQLNILKKEYEKHQNSLKYYEQYALPQAELLIKSAMKSYKSGEIEYVEFVQNSQQAWQIKETYLSTILNYNQTIIQIETLLGIE
jgi:cobalt-zinc-cadmium resistance protein CzcA